MENNTSSTINVPVIPGMREAWKRLRSGGMICREALSSAERDLYALVYKHREAYEAFFNQLDCHLEGDEQDGLFYLCQLNKNAQTQSSQFVNNKELYLSILFILNSFNPEIRPGNEFNVSTFLTFLEHNDGPREAVFRLKKLTETSLIKRGEEFLSKVLFHMGIIDFFPGRTRCYVKSSWAYVRDYYLKVRFLGEAAEYNTGNEINLDTSDESEEAVIEDIIENPDMFNEE